MHRPGLLLLGALPRPGCARPLGAGSECKALTHWRATLQRASRQPASDHRKLDHLHYLVRLCIGVGARWHAGAPNDSFEGDDPRDPDAPADAAIPAVAVATLDQVASLMDRRELLTANDWAGYEYVATAALTCLAASRHKAPPTAEDVSQWLRASAAHALPAPDPTAPASMESTAAVLIEVLHRVRCNAFAVVNEDGERLGAALFPLASLFNHSCEPTCEFVYTVGPARCGAVDGTRPWSPSAHCRGVALGIGPARDVCNRAAR